MKSNTGQYLKFAAFLWSGCLVVFLLAYMAVLRPLHKRQIQVETEYRKVKAESEEAYMASLAQTKTRMNEHIQQLKEQLGEFVLEPQNTSSLTYQLSDISGKIGINPAVFDCTPTGQTVAAFDQCKYVSGQYYQVSFTASFTQFARFLNELERYRPVIFIDAFSISRPRQGETEPKVSMTLAVLVAKDEKVKNLEG
jgi:hypothetical protein